METCCYSNNTIGYSFYFHKGAIDLLSRTSYRQKPTHKLAIMKDFRKNGLG